MAEGSTLRAQLQGRARIPASTREAWLRKRASLIAILAAEILKPLIHLLAVRIAPAEPPQPPPA